MKTTYISVLIILLCSTLYGQLSFTAVDAGLHEVYYGDAVWSDFNNNGLLDILLTGYTYGEGSLNFPYTEIFRNNGDGTFSNMEAGLFDLGVSKAVAGDLNNNGWNDIAIFGYTGLGGSSYFKVYMNNGDETFTEMISGIPDLYLGDLVLGDFNKNGLLDILVAGQMQDGQGITRIYLNNGDFTFIDLGVDIIGVTHSAVACGDLNNNGWLDIVISGRIGSFNYVAYIYMNNGDGTFTESTQPLIGLRYSSISLGDYNNDGYLDILMNGSDNSEEKYTLIYKNNGDGTFININADIVGTRQGYVAWGDFNNNGLLDFVVSGEIDNAWTTRLFLQTGTDTFTNSNLTFVDARRSTVVPADYNNDGKLDFLLIGWAASQNYLAIIYENMIPTVNTPASAPTGLFTTLTDDGVQFNWQQATGGTTPANGLTYNLRVGTNSNGYDIVSPMAHIDTGFRRVAALGKYSFNSAQLNDLEDGVYYWSVQAIDHIYSGSLFSTEQIFTIGDIPDPTDPPLLFLPPDESEDLATNVHLQWEAVTNAVYYTVQVATDTDFDDIIYTSNLALTNNWISSLDFNQTYYWRVNSNNGVFPSAWSEVWSFNTIESLATIEIFEAEVLNIDNVDLTWQEPVSIRNRQEEVSGYRIYRNNALIMTIEDSVVLSYLDEGLNNGDYTYHITALFGEDMFGGLYESLPSEPQSVTIYLLPPQNLTADSGAGYVDLFWEAPTANDLRQRALEGYNIYRNGVQIGSVSSSELLYTDTNVTNGVLYNYFIRAAYSGGVSVPSNSVSIAPAIPALYPPRDLTYQLEGDEVHLQWYSYLDGEWFSWDNGMNSGGIGTNSPVQFEVAARFEPADLLPFDGKLLQFISFVPRQVQCNYSVRVWINGSIVGDVYDPGDLIVDQAINTTDLVMMEWNVIELIEPVLINVNQELWIGYHIDTETGYPAGRDAGPAVVNKGDLVNLEGWESLSIMNPNLNYNWNIQGLAINNTNGEIITLQPLPYNANQRNNRTEILSSQEAFEPVRFLDYFRYLTGYKVYRNGIELVEITEPQETFYIDTLPNYGVFHYYITALYGEYESLQSNIQTVIFTSVDDEVTNAPKTHLKQNYPNPFNPETQIDFSLANDCFVRIELFNVKGQHIVTLMAEELRAGEYSINWNGKDSKEREVPAGIYFYRLRTQEEDLIRKMILLK
ncbi:MAG: VCBS repeat-containing protein [Candidatus Cloacimonetes bacterium]|nr:VCBS repeat-containing protein [Candidatus Cloacimonadota bacterium]